MFLATFCWAANIVAIKEALDGFSALATAQLRVTGAAILFMAIHFLRRARPMPRLNRREWGFIVLVAMSGVALNQLFFVGGIARSSVAHTGLIVALGPIMVLVLSVVMRLEVLTIPKFVGMLVSFGGAALLTFGKLGHGANPYWGGDLLLLAGSAVFAYYTILVKEAVRKYDPLTLNILAYAVGVFLIAPFTTHATLSVRWEDVPFHAWWGLAMAIVVGSVLPYTLFAIVMTELTAARVAAFAYVQPVIATGLGIWLVDEKLTVKFIVGGVLILAGVSITERERGEEQAAQFELDRQVHTSIINIMK